MVFHHSTNGHMYAAEESKINGVDWSGHFELVRNVGGDPVVGTNRDGRLELFFRGTDEALWHRPQKFV